ncbi:unnamed protein product [Leishmania donovani]|uniref:Uncharacterized protein n=1 Tax=Leishmania donovani TaxID=5661 RepID=E9B7V0_LEIDO|nr:uncharacterized protein LDBPK_030970 [Leishmania donovani]CBZ31323.1 unnamed protein product [Leishmania donovani]
MFSYLPADAKEKLALYVYRSEDRSYLYNHMWRPLCRKVVDYLPVWLAPNIITVAALAFVGTTHGLLAYYMPKLTVSGEHYLTRSETGTTPLQLVECPPPPPPAFVFVLAAVALFLYQLLDNLDGHQARRTGTSSPLGMLMDHGCDAVNCIIGALSVATAVSAGPSWKTWLIVLNTVITFFPEHLGGVLPWRARATRHQRPQRRHPHCDRRLPVDSVGRGAAVVVQERDRGAVSVVAASTASASPAGGRRH